MTTPPNHPEALFRLARNSFHTALLSSGVLSTNNGVASNADSGSPVSVGIANAILNQIQANTAAAPRLPGQIAGNRFEQITRAFLTQTFPALMHLRPGAWDLNPATRSIARFDQYRHLLDISEIAEQNPQLTSVIGRDYIIAPDIVIVREPEPEEAINAPQLLVDESVATRSSLRRRQAHGQPAILHASISCKWTIRSDRVQNSRFEALNLIRNRKGHLPHIVVVTGEPLPSRIASIALGTGDIDAVYHFALPELMHAVHGMGDTENLVTDMVNGKRLKDISDLPLDIAV